MAKLEDLRVGARVEGVVVGTTVTLRGVEHHGGGVLTITYRDDANGATGERLLFPGDELKLRIVEEGRSYAFDGDGDLFQLVAEANRLRLAHLFDTRLAVHLSSVVPLPHQIAAVYEEMLPRQPLRFLLADDPGAGKTIMSGLLIQELRLRADVERCLIVVPANLGDQWVDELDEKFGLEFKLLGRQEIESARSGNPFIDNHLAVSRIDLLKQDDVLRKLEAAPDWDLVIVDEAHKMSASYTGGDVRKTARYRLGELLGRKTRHLLLLTATPHRGKPEEFQLFLALLDQDRFAGVARSGSRIEPQDVMRRMLKEELVDFDGQPLFPERRAYTVNYELSDDEAILYEEVTRYVREGMNRADRLATDATGKRRRAVVGFALTTLQRRLASSPAAIEESLKRRLKRLQHDLEVARQAGRAQLLDPLDDLLRKRGLTADLDDLEEDLEEEPEKEIDELVSGATPAETIAELKAEISQLKKLVTFAGEVRRSGVDRKWEKLREVLDSPEMFDLKGVRRKLVIFTEHRDTLDYLTERIAQLLGGPDRVVAIHGGLLRLERQRAQERFMADPQTLVLVATDAAGEGINLQRANLMVNYDLPWNPNRIEQRFGRIHRFGQREVCHVWNLVAFQTREGAVFQRLFEKLEEERRELRGKVFDVLGELFTEVSLRDLMLEAIRTGSSDDARTLARQKVDPLFTDQLHQAVEARALYSIALDADRLRRLRDQMDRADALRIIPHVIEQFFVDAFRRLGGSIARREPHRYHISNVPTEIRQRDRLVGRGAPLHRTYERVCFDRELVHLQGRPQAVFVAPGHPLFDATLHLFLERHRDLLRRGAILVDDGNNPPVPRVLFSVESAIKCGITVRDGQPLIISRRMGYIALGADGTPFPEGPAAHLDYRPPSEAEAEAARRLRDAFSPGVDLERAAEALAIEHVVRPHLDEVAPYRRELADRTERAVRQRLTAEITRLDAIYARLKDEEAAGRKTRLPSENVHRQIQELGERLERRLREIELERDIQALPPLVHAAALVVPAALLRSDPGDETVERELADARRIERIAMDYVMTRERAEGREPVDVSGQHLGWDIESREPGGALRLIEVKGRRRDADVVQLTRNEYLAALNRGPHYYLAVVLVDGDRVVDYVCRAGPAVGDDVVATISVDIDRLRESVGEYRP